MSGGAFNYEQYKIDYIIDKIQNLLEDNDDDYFNQFSEETIIEIKTGILLLKQARIYAQRIDWLISGDDGEESFHIRLKEEMEKLLK